MRVSFTKYQGTGNDFIMLNNMSRDYSDLSIEQVSFLCYRKLGIGADGLIIVSESNIADFHIDYYNSDGSQSFCGNGARCSIAFAKEIGIINSETRFDAIDGIHSASIIGDIVRLEMLSVDKIESIGEDFFVETGSPHYVHLKRDDSSDIITYGRRIRHSERYEKEGVNVNYLNKISNNSIEVETYERGVENETLSCGTGVTACALVQMKIHSEIDKVNVQTKGGNLTVEAERNQSGGFKNIWLSGPTKRVFDGSINV